MSEPQAPPERLTGHVKWFNSAKGFGFITIEGSEDEVFVHQSNIDTTGFRSLHEGEEVEFDLVIGEDEKKKAFHVTGPGGAPPLGSIDPARAGFSGRAPGMRQFEAPFPGVQPFSPAAYPQQPSPPGGSGRGTTPIPQPQGYFPPMPSPEAAYMAGYYPMAPGAGYPGYAMFPRGRGQFFPGGRNWAGARPPPPGQPGFSSGLQVVVHNLPWDCTWQQLKDAFSDCGDIERADVVFDSRGRSRGFGIVRFPTKEMAEMAVAKMNNASIGGRVVSVRLDRFA